MKNILLLNWVVVVSVLLFMITGHMGSHELDWMASQISTYAARAPLDYLVTASMVLASLSLLLTGFIVSRYRVLGSGFMAHFIPALTGAAASGLIVLASFEETAPSLAQLKQAGFWAVRIQSFHDAGLMVFFYSSLLLFMLLGMLVVSKSVRLKDRMLGMLIFLTAPLAFLLMTTHWPVYLGIDGPATGLNQRASLLCLWLATVCFLAVLRGESGESEYT